MKTSFHQDKTVLHGGRRMFPVQLSGLILLAGLLCCLPAAAAGAKEHLTNTLTVSEIHYAGELSGDEARFTLNLAADATGESSLFLLKGDIAVLPSKLPAGLSIVRQNDRYFLTANGSGHYHFKL